MKITEKVILDLLPLYFADEASHDTKTLVESYLDQHPGFAKAMQRHSSIGLPEDIPIILKQEDAMIILNKTKSLFRFRTMFLVIGIFFSLVPFAFGDTSGSEIEGVHWLWSPYPEGAVLSGVIGLMGWLGYFVIRRRLRTTAL